MPKDKTSNYLRLRHFVSEFGDEVFSIDASILFCKLCECKVNSDKKFNVTQHLKTDKHLKAIKREQNKIEKKQQLLKIFHENVHLISIYARLLFLQIYH